MAIVNQPADAAPPRITSRHAQTELRRHMLSMARGHGQGYIGQGLGIADVLAALYFHELRYDPEDASAGRAATASCSRPATIRSRSWAALAEAGILPVEELSTYGADDSRLEMSTLDTTPGVEVIGGSLGHGLGQAVGMALGLRLDGSRRRVFVELSDGEMQEGSTWEAAMAAAHFRPRQPGRADRLQRHPGGRRDRHRHGAGRRQVARLRLGDAARSTATTWTRSSARSRRARTAPASRRRSCCAPCPGRACRRSRSARRRISSASSRGEMGSAASRQSMGGRIVSKPHRAARSRWARTKDPAPAPTVEAPFGQALAELARDAADIVGLTADLGKYTDIQPFRDAFPERFFNVGMAEQNLVAVAAGLARTGTCPFATTYGVFATRRAYDFIAIALRPLQAST